MFSTSEDEINRHDTSDYEQGIVEEEEEFVYESDEEVKASGLSKADHINQRSCHVKDLEEKIELLILETKAGHDGLYNEMLKISKHLLCMNVNNQE